MEKLDAYDMTNAQIRELQREAHAAGDLDMVRLCTVACGDEETSTQSEMQAAREACADAINEARAQVSQ